MTKSVCSHPYRSQQINAFLPTTELYRPNKTPYHTIELTSREGQNRQDTIKRADRLQISSKIGKVSERTGREKL